jgi:hypothetical protein
MVASFLYVLVPNTLFRIIVVIIAFLWSTLGTTSQYINIFSLTQFSTKKIRIEKYPSVSFFDLIQNNKKQQLKIEISKEMKMKENLKTMI